MSDHNVCAHAQAATDASDRPPAVLGATSYPKAGTWFAIWLCLIAIAAIGSSHLLIRLTVDRVLQSEAERTARSWAHFLATNSEDVGQFTEEHLQNRREFEIVRNAMGAQQVFRFKLFGHSGELLFDSAAANERKADETLHVHNAAAAETALTGHTHSAFFSDVTRAGLPSHYSEAYAPVVKNGRIAAVTEVYVDQSVRHAERQAQGTFLSMMVGLIVAVAVSVPATFLVQRSKHVARAEIERRMQSARFAAAVESMPHGFSMFDGRDRLVACNTRYRRMYALPDHLAVAGAPVRDLVKYSRQAGVLPDEFPFLSAKGLSKLAPDGIAERTWHLADGRVIAVAISPMADGGRVSIHTDITEHQRTAARIAESESRFRDFASAAADWCWETDSQHRFTFFTDRFQAATGIDPATLIGKTREEATVHPEDVETIRAHARIIAERLPFRDFHARVIRPDGKYAHIRSNGAPRFGADGQFLGYRGTAHDVTLEERRKAELKQAEDALRQRTHQLVEAQRLGKIGDWSYTLGSQHQDWGPELYELLRIEPGPAPISHDYVMSRYLGNDAERVKASHREILGKREARTVDVKFRRGDDTILDCAITSTAIYDRSGAIIGFCGTVQDISERKRAEEQLEKLAFYDPLTGLANRAMFSRQLDSVVAQRMRTGGNSALLLLDLDRFKEVNDSLGHFSGDQLLSKVGAIVAGAIDPAHFLARLGGDEFAVIVQHAGDQQAVEQLAARIVDAVSGSIQLDHGEVTIGTSIGIAFMEGDAVAAAALLRNADLALYKAKEQGRGRFEVFRPEMGAELQHKVLLERDLRRAISDNVGLWVQYQPQIDLAEGKVVGFEALMRWTHPELGPISPGEFIPVAEGSHLIIDLGRWVLRQAATQMKAWIDAGEQAREISVNVSAAQIWHSDLVEDVASILEETGLPSHLLCLELTESLLADPSEQRVRTQLGRLKELGVKLALDDFGTDYSSLGYLTQLPFDQLKIDRVFIDGVAASPRRRELLKGIVALGHGLGMTVIGEGTERVEEVEILIALGCNVAQGYVLARPLPADQAVAAARSFAMPVRDNEVHALQRRLSGTA